MKRPGVLLLAWIPALLLAQTVPRAPVVRVGTPAVVTPTPLSDPTGVYSGNAAVTLQGQSGTFNEPWRIVIHAQPCAECAAGEYFLYGTNYDGSRYVGGAVERGGVYGFLSRSGNAVGLELFAINCGFVNPTDYRPPVSGSNGYAGDEYAGSFGESPGSAVTIMNGTLAGRFSGRDCFGQLITADVSLQKQSGVPIPGSCAQLAGTYTATFANTCGGTGSGTITVRQTGCYFGGLVVPLSAGIDGTVTSPTTATILLNDTCAAAIYSGTATINANGTITGSYSGTSRGGVGCCPPGPFSGSFTATRR